MQDITLKDIEELTVNTEIKVSMNISIFDISVTDTIPVGWYGVYIIYTKHDEAYIGGSSKGIGIRGRLLSHMHEAWHKGIIKQIDVFETGDCYAMQLERMLIKMFKPELNTIMYDNYDKILSEDEQLGTFLEDDNSENREKIRQKIEDKLENGIENINKNFEKFGEGWGKRYEKVFKEWEMKDSKNDNICHKLKMKYEKKGIGNVDIYNKLDEDWYKTFKKLGDESHERLCALHEEYEQELHKKNTKCSIFIDEYRNEMVEAGFKDELEQSHREMKELADRAILLTKIQYAK